MNDQAERVRCPKPSCHLDADHDGDCMVITTNDDPAFSCLRKKRYSTENFAIAVAAKCFNDRGHRVRHYSCNMCGGWHLTHQNVDTSIEAKPGWSEARTPRAIALDERQRERGGKGRRKRHRK